MSATERDSASSAEASVRHAERTPGKPCLQLGGEDVSYRSMRGRAGRFKVALAGWGLRPGERVALLLGIVREDFVLTAENGRDFCRENLAGYKKPSEVVFVDELSRNAPRKVLEHEVREELGETEE